MAKEPAVYADGGPWKEFIIADPDGYHLAFGGIDGGRARCSINPKIDSAFLWVRHLDRAVDRYAKLMAIEVKQQDRFGHLHMFRLDNGTHLILDANGMDQIPVPEPGLSPVLFKLDTNEIDRAAIEARKLGFEVVYGIERLAQVAFFQHSGRGREHPNRQPGIFRGIDCSMSAAPIGKLAALSFGKGLFLCPDV